MFKVMNETDLMNVNGGATKGVPIYKDGYIYSWAYIDYNSPIVEYRWEPDFRLKKWVCNAYTYHKFRD